MFPELFGVLSRSLAALLVLLIPGWSLLAWLPGNSLFQPSRRRDFLSIVADGVALSIALAALAALLCSFLKVQVRGTGLIVLYALGFVILLGGAIWRRARLSDNHDMFRLVSVILGFLLLVAIIVWRLFQARDLALPAWVDSVHHALIIELIRAHGGLPSDFLPYFPTRFDYHYGFHLITALFTFWTRLSTSEAMLWFGQVLNALVSISVYRLAYTLAVDIEVGPDSTWLARWRPFALAFTAALLTGFTFQMPAYYLTWGRYTLLTGLILLGPALAAAWEVRREPAHPGAGLRLALFLTGISLTHYFVLILAALFVGVLGVYSLILFVHDRSQGRTLIALAAWSGLGVVLGLPWLLPVGQANLGLAGASLVSPIGQSEAALEKSMGYLRYIIYLLGPRHSHVLLGMAGVGLLFALRRAALRPLAIWTLLLGLFSLPWGLRLDLFRPDYFTIIMFFPASILLADLLVSGVASLDHLWRRDPDRRIWVQPIILSVLLALFLIWGLRETRNVINTVTVMAGPVDVTALDWVRQNTPPEARFFINSNAWGNGLYRGIDGGYWLTPYSGRSSLIPPVLYGLAGPEYFQQVTVWAERAGKLQGCSPEFWSLVRDAGLTHLYLRQGRGTLQPDQLVNCPRLKLIYVKGTVFIYEILRPE